MNAMLIGSPQLYKVLLATTHCGATGGWVLGRVGATLYLNVGDRVAGTGAAVGTGGFVVGVRVGAFGARVGRLV